MGPKKALNRVYLEKYKELEAETSANENGILVNILWKFEKKKFSGARDIAHDIFLKTGAERPTERQWECGFFVPILWQ